MTDPKIDTVQTIYEAFGRGDIATILDLLDDDGIRLRAGNESSNSNRKVFSSDNAVNTANQPRLTITYISEPSTH